MKFLFVLDNYSKYFSIDDVVRELYQRGHDISIIMGLEEKRNVPDDAVQKAKADLPNLQIESLLKRRYLKNLVKDIRELLNYAHILNHEKARRWDAVKWGRYFHPLVWRMITSRAGKIMLKSRSFQKMLRFIEQMIPVDARIAQQIKHQHPDVVITLPLISGDSKENEYIKASLTLGIPCVYSMFSWDNIASKGTFQSHPDYSIVWSKSLAEELAHMHGIPNSRIFITGAPRFDRLLNGENEYIMAKGEFCRAAGLNGEKKYILYVGSTFLVTNEFKKAINEEELVLEIVDKLQENPRTRGINTLFRPHPLNAGVVKTLLEHKRTNISVYPLHGEFPDTEEKRRMFYNSIHHSIAVVGVNTTAFLEASALDKPCITIVTETFGETQQLPHFHHLADAGFLETVNGPEELANLVGKIMDGMDARAEQRRAFVKNFLRLTDSTKSAAEAYADLVEKIGHKSIMLR